VKVTFSVGQEVFEKGRRVFTRLTGTASKLWLNTPRTLFSMVVPRRLSFFSLLPLLLAISISISQGFCHASHKIIWSSNPSLGNVAATIRSASVRGATRDAATKIESFSSGSQDTSQTGKCTENELSFTVYGEPEPLSRHRSTSRGHMYNPSAKLQSEFAEACSQFMPSEPLDGPLEARLFFYFSRPRSHYRQGKYSHILKEDADKWHWKRKDLDNLVKFVLDSLNKRAYLDDGQICVIQSAKFYTDDANKARTEVVFKKLDKQL